MRKLNYQKPKMRVSSSYAEGNICTGTIPISDGSVENPWAKEGIEEDGYQIENHSLWDE